ncbi:MAG: MurR/RpiR family transcriptional regulator [Anaerolineae bacterium]|nr:MurR/RpiR family transcriptional regulator [Anaerolineae bacterium]
MFRDRIQNRYEMLSPRFRALADFILENTLDVGFMTATELARRVSVDPATVVRFSQELGYSGFRELSREIKNYINTQLALRYGHRESSGGGLAGEISQLIDEASNRTLDMKVDAEQIAQIAKSIRAARRILITGTSAGLSLAELWTTHLRLIGYPVEVSPADPAQAALALKELGPGDLVIAIALGLASGTELGPLLAVAAELGAETASITTSPTLLPAREASVNLVVPAKTPSGYPTFDTVAIILSILWQALILEDGSGTTEGVEDSMQTLMQLIEQGDRLSHYDSAALMRLWKQPVSS